MINQINPLQVVFERLGYVDPAKGAFFFWDEVKNWPSGALDVLVTSSLLRQAQPMTTIECDGCEEKCINKPVVIYPAQEDKPGRAFIECDERDGMGRIRVSFDRMRQWQTTGGLFAAVLTKLLGLSQPSTQAPDGKQWDIGTLRGKEHRSPITLLAGDGLALTLAGHIVPLATVLTIEEKSLALDKAELIRLVDNPAGDSKAGGAAQGISGNPCDVFLAMKKLTADEVSITFVGDKTEYGIGTNNLLEISARGETKSVALATIGLIDLHSRSLNEQCATLLGMAQKMNMPSSVANKKKISRLREVFRRHLGVSDDPFDPYRKGAGWVPRFKIFDKRGTADKRALREAGRNTVSLEELTERGTQFGDTNQTHQSFSSENDPENDAAADWLKDNDPDAPA